jgi:hypothetical protein
MLQDSKRRACAVLCCMLVVAGCGDDDSGNADMMGGATGGKDAGKQSQGSGGDHSSGGTGGKAGHAGSSGGTGGTTHMQMDAGMHARMDAATGSSGSGGAQDAATDGGGNTSSPCDLSGTWISQHITHNSALGAEQIATNWNYLVIEQTGDDFTITANFDCGYVVRGTTDVALSDDTLEAMAVQASHGVGTKGTFAATNDGKCKLDVDRIYVLRGANKPKFLDAVWKIGDAPKSLDDFTLPANADEGMEDWDHDGHEGLTQLTGLGDRYSAEFDWREFHGTVPQDAAQFGGDGVIRVDYDSRESVSAETPALLQASSSPMSPGYGFMAHVGDDEVAATGDHKELQTCKNVQAKAIEKFGDPPAP